jgi:hypothetical protein
MSAIHGVNYGTPTLDLNFAKNKSLIDTVTGRNLVTFTRASTGTYVGADGLIKTAVANEPRFDHNPVTGESLGLLVEEARTNLTNYSEQFDNAAWSKVNAAIIPNTATAPDGTITADKFIPAIDAVRPLARNTSGGNTSATRVLSVFAKAAEANWLILGGTGVAAWGVVRVDLTTGAFALLNHIYGAPTYVNVERYPNGWWRVSVIVAAESPSIGASVNANWGFGSSGGDGTSGIFVWGFQMETGAFPTSYIPTVASTVTRAADVASITGANFSSWWNPNSSTYYVSVFSRATTKDNNAILGINGSDSERQVQFSMNGSSTNSVQISTRVGSVFYTSSVSTTSLGVPIKAVGIINGTEIKIGVNGTLGNSSSPPRIASSIPTTMDIGRFIADSQYSLNGTIARLTYYPTRLQDFQLQQITK